MRKETARRQKRRNRISKETAGCSTFSVLGCTFIDIGYFSSVELESLTNTASSNDEAELITGQASATPVTPPPIQRPPYSGSTHKERRDRLAQLARERKQKRRQS
jgi:hypothetical protein